MWRTGSTALVWKPEAPTDTCVSSTCVVLWSNKSNFPHLATNTETINSKGFMKLFLSEGQRKTNWWIKWLMWKSQSCLGKKQKPYHRFLKFTRKIQSVHFSKCLDRLLFFFPQPQFLLNIFVVWIQTRTIEPEVSYETYFRCMNYEIWMWIL